MPYIKPVESDEVVLPSDATYHVRLKKRATYGDQLSAQSAMLRLETGTAGVVSQVEWAEYIQSLTVAMILDWNLTDENDQPLPITASSLARLAPEDGEFLATEVASRAKTRAVEQERPFALPLSKP